jgi:hypothetical protein
MNEDMTSGLTPELASLLRDPRIITPQHAYAFDFIASTTYAPAATASAVVATEASLVDDLLFRTEQGSTTAAC